MSQVVNCPFQGTIDADGTAKIETVKQQSYTLVGEAHYEISHDIESVLACFAVSQETEPNGTVALEVAVTNAGTLKDAISTAFRAGSVANGAHADMTGAPAASGLIEAVLAAVHEAAFNASLDENGVNDALEASAVKENQFTDFSGNVTSGCEALANAINDAGAAAGRRLLALQLPEGRYTNETMHTSLPFEDGDSLRIRFTVSSDFVLSNDAQTLVATTSGDANGNGAIGATDAPNSAVELSTSTKTWIIDLVLNKGAVAQPPA